jgi:hypothetical protein
MDKVLKELYYAPRGGFEGIQRMHAKARKKIPGITRSQVSQWLHSQPTYAIHKFQNKRPTRRKYWSPASFIMLEADLAFLRGASSNHNRPGFLLLICLFSRFIVCRQIKSKRAVHIAALVKEVLDEPRFSVCQSFRSDQVPPFPSLPFRKHSIAGF